ncbi:NmrA family NAD(P)-binding protein [Microbacterium album]|uniref:NmrA family transcriptional regulator n=1 Tax=Microbacterium album TaxID=2053191 RepID=A0A917IDT6_9MICO|nr:NmrA family NAD(P)-binding protein [Microbacterium album]GGH39150.1 NmrA family transcriptional regulator [Microbacterium album]
MRTETILITAGTGKIGSRVADRLAAAGIDHRVGSRGSDVRFDWYDEGTWPAFLDGGTAALVSFVPDLGFPGAADIVARFGRRAAAAGVRSFVLISGRGEEGAAAAEQLLAQEVGPITVLRCAWFQQNFSESFLADPVREGVIALPAGRVAEPFIDAEDIADVAVACLTDPARHGGAVHELTGPELLTFADAAAILSDVTGRRIDYLAVTADDYVQRAVAGGLGLEEARAFADLFSTITDGRNASLADGVRAILGRPAGRFADYASRTAPTGVWEAR